MGWVLSIFVSRMCLVCWAMWMWKQNFQSMARNGCGWGGGAARWNRKHHHHHTRDTAVAQADETQNAITICSDVSCNILICLLIWSGIYTKLFLMDCCVWNFFSGFCRWWWFFCLNHVILSRFLNNVKTCFISTLVIWTPQLWLSVHI
jgi:hypothetical protein